MPDQQMLPAMTDATKVEGQILVTLCGVVCLRVTLGVHLHFSAGVAMPLPEICSCSTVNMGDHLIFGCVPDLIDAVLPLLSHADRRYITSLRENAVPRREE